MDSLPSSLPCQKCYETPHFRRAAFSATVIFGCTLITAFVITLLKGVTILPFTSLFSYPLLSGWLAVSGVSFILSIFFLTRKPHLQQQPTIVPSNQTFTLLVETAPAGSVNSPSTDKDVWKNWSTLKATATEWNVDSLSTGLGVAKDKIETIFSEMQLCHEKIPTLTVDLIMQADTATASPPSCPSVNSIWEGMYYSIEQVCGSGKSRTTWKLQALAAFLAVDSNTLRTALQQSGVVAQSDGYQTTDLNSFFFDKKKVDSTFAQARTQENSKRWHLTSF